MRFDGTNGTHWTNGTYEIQAGTAGSHGPSKKENRREACRALRGGKSSRVNAAIVRAGGHAPKQFLQTRTTADRRVIENYAVQNPPFC